MTCNREADQAGPWTWTLLRGGEFPKGPVYFNEAACSWNGPGVCRWDYVSVCGVFEINRCMRGGGGRTQLDGF